MGIRPSPSRAKLMPSTGSGISGGTSSTGRSTDQVLSGWPAQRASQRLSSLQAALGSREPLGSGSALSCARLAPGPITQHQQSQRSGLTNKRTNKQINKCQRLAGPASLSARPAGLAWVAWLPPLLAYVHDGPPGLTSASAPSRGRPPLFRPPAPPLFRPPRPAPPSRVLSRRTKRPFTPTVEAEVVAGGVALLVKLKRVCTQGGGAEEYT